MTNVNFDKQEQELRKQLMDMRFDLKCGKMANTSNLKKTRRELARLLTLKRLSNG
ncbi:MAG: 50S ribosomal protein L29 [Deltaproteobacteria bacterium]|nr:50S ribosomal protein L29 [Deltaproteobacteria bacterium]